jgi:3-hydroxyethyl bacteriochlorophyllide a dehydrogenase
MQFFDLGEPEDAGPTEILIRTHFSGITNGTERHGLMDEHGLGRWPGRHGYQHVGRVEAAGGDVEAFAAGDWVFQGRYVGHRAWHVVDVASPAQRLNESHLCIKLPAEADHKRFALMGVAGVATRAVRRCRVAAGQAVWVAGAGLIGQFSAQAARAVGARVSVSDVNEKRLAIARELGMERVVDAGSESAFAELQGGGPYDCIIDACGVPSLFNDIHRHGLLARRGVIGAIAARTEFTCPWSLLHGREASIEVSCHFSLDDLRVLLHFIRTQTVRIEPLIGDFIPIDEAPGIYATMRDNPGELLGVVFDWTA